MQKRVPCDETLLLKGLMRRIIHKRVVDNTAKNRYGRRCVQFSTNLILSLLAPQKRFAIRKYPSPFHE